MAETEDAWGKIVNLQEIALPSPDMRVDREKGVIRGVRILGPSSLNGRKYAPQAIERARSLYEDRPVNIDHPGGDTHSAQRRVSDRFGWLKAIEFREGGLRGELHYLKSHPQAEAVIEAAERNPALFGLSHNADGRLSRKGSEYLVEEIVGVRSVDLVADPATTKSLFESLQEQSMDDLAPPVAPSGGASDTFDILVGKLREIWDGDGDAGGKAGAINKIVRTFLKLEDALAGADKPAESKDGPPKDEPTKESIAQKAVADTLTALQESIGKLAKQVETIQKAVETPIRRPRNVPLVEGQGSYTPPKDSKETARRLVGR